MVSSALEQVNVMSKRMTKMYTTSTVGALRWATAWPGVKSFAVDMSHICSATSRSWIGVFVLIPATEMSLASSSELERYKFTRSMRRKTIPSRVMYYLQKMIQNKWLFSVLQGYTIKG
jgi:hypothetical protein